MSRLFFRLLAMYLVIAPQAMAQTAQALPQPSLNEIVMKMLPMFVVVFVVFHFMIVRPQKTRETSHQALLKSLKNGESVVTSSGIIGRVAGIAPEHVTLEVASGVKIRFEPAFIVKREAEEKKK